MNKNQNLPATEYCPLAHCAWADSNGVCTVCLGSWCPNLQRRRIAEARWRIRMLELESLLLCEA